MKRQVFNSGGILRILLTCIITATIVLLVYHAIQNMYVHLVWIIFIIHSITVLRNRVVIKHGVLYIEKLFGSKEVPLADVSQIVVERLDTTYSSGKEKTANLSVNILGDTGRLISKFPYSYVHRGVAKQRFIDAVHATNPGIYVNLEPDHHHSNYKEYTNRKHQNNG